MKPIIRLIYNSRIFICSAFLFISFSCSNVERFHRFFFVQISDPQIGMTTIEQDSIAFTRAVQIITTIEPLFTVITGDLVHHPDSAREWDVFDYIMKQIPRRVYLVPGNHDIGYKPNKELLTRYREKYGKDYYSVYRQYCLFTAMNSQYFIDDTSDGAKKQEKWLEGALNPFAKRPVHKFVFMHIPLFRHSPEDEDSYEIIPKKHRHRLLRMFTEAGVDYVITGHNHCNHVNKYENMQLISTGSTSKIIGTQEYGVGFRVFEVYSDMVKHYYVELDNPIQEVILQR